MSAPPSVRSRVAATRCESGRHQPTTWAQAGGALFPYKDQDLANYASKLDQAFVETLTGAEFVRFDGSDQMPSAVGSGTFWSEMVKLVSGSQDVDTTLGNIEASWPQ